jgi:hypothetical protein
MLPHSRQINNGVRKMSLFWWRWLVLVSIGVMLFGLSMIVFPDLIEALFNVVAFQNREIDDLFGAEAVHYIQFVYGVLGAVMAGWMIPLLFILFGAFRRGEREGWLAIALSIGLWFVVDTVWSAYMGFWGNVVLNIGFFLLYFVPLAATFRSFYGSFRRQD